MNRSNGKILFNRFPWIRFQLLVTERNFPFGTVDTQYFGFDDIAEVEYFRGMFNMLSPGNFRNMNQPLNAFFKFDKHAIVGNINDFTLHDCINRVFIFNTFPGMGSKLFQTQRYSLFLLIVIDNLDGQFLIHLDDFLRMIDPAPGNIGNMQQSVQTAQIDEDTKVGDVLYPTSHNVADLDLGQQVIAFFLHTFFE